MTGLFSRLVERTRSENDAARPLVDSQVITGIEFGDPSDAAASAPEPENAVAVTKRRSEPLPDRVATASTRAEATASPTPRRGAPPAPTTINTRGSIPPANDHSVTSPTTAHMLRESRVLHAQLAPAPSLGETQGAAHRGTTSARTTEQEQANRRPRDRAAGKPLIESPPAGDQPLRRSQRLSAPAAPAALPGTTTRTTLPPTTAPDPAPKSAEPIRRPVPNPPARTTLRRAEPSPRAHPQRQLAVAEQPSASPPITITIGHIHVSPALPRPEAPSTPAARLQTHLTLDEYRSRRARR